MSVSFIYLRSFHFIPSGSFRLLAFNHSLGVPDLFLRLSEFGSESVRRFLNHSELSIVHDSYNSGDE